MTAVTFESEVDAMQTQSSAKKSAKKAKAAGLNPMLVRVSQVMTKNVTTTRPEVTLASAMEVLVTRDIGHLPVVDGEGQLIGILSKTDLVRDSHLQGDTTEVDKVRIPSRGGVTYPADDGFHQDLDPRRTVADAMTTRLKTVLDSAPLTEAALVMSKNRIHGVPVVNEKNRLVGFLSTFDVVDWVASA